MNIGIYIYENAEVLDFSGPFEVFATASRLAGVAGLLNVFLVAETRQLVRARGGYEVKPGFSFADHPPIDVLVVAGGVHTQEMQKKRVIDWVATTASSASLVTSVCTGAFLLAEAGLLTNCSVTTHWEDIPDLRKSYPTLTVLENQRWVDAGNIVTSGGISAGIDMSLYLVSKLCGMALAEKTARQMEFDWQRNR